MRAAWALAVIGQLNVATRDKLLQDASPYVRGWAIQLSLDQAASDAKLAGEGLLKQLVALARNDDSPVTRLYLLRRQVACRRPERWDVLQGLVAHSSDVNDHNLPLMIWYAAEPLAEIDPNRALAFAINAGKNIPLIRDYMLRRIGARGDLAALGSLVDGLGQAKRCHCSWLSWKPFVLR